MKKILVVLLMLAVATGVFALDGEWSLSGQAEIGTLVDLGAKDSAGNSAPSVIYGIGYNIPYDGYDNPFGKLSIGYNWESLSLGIGIKDTGSIDGSIEWDGENYKFYANADLSNLISKPWSTGNFGRLWGWYKFLNGLVHLEVGYKSRDNGNDKLWVSDKTAAFANNGDSIAHGTNGKGLWGIDGGYFAKVDGDQMLLTNVVLSNLNFGFMLKNLYKEVGWPDYYSDEVKFVDDVLKKLIIGFKFEMQPIEVAASFKMDNYGVYFGGRWFIGSVTAGLSFTGLLGSDDPKEMKFGGGVEYKPGAFGASINAYYALKKDQASSANDPAGSTQIGIVPGFFYNVIPTHLQFRADFGFYLNGGKNTDNSKRPTEVAWAVQPQLFWNFLGTGADDGYYGASGGWSGKATGIIVRYRLISGVDGIIDDSNKLDVTFRWHF